ncbi:MAG: Holliday junction branch migration protein RuvA [Candidatus Paceibacter sp.]|nr:Holliday junction branch migration protein RuvA [Candidatus Paceibacter sp.]
MEPMIASVEGKIKMKGDKFLIVDTGGIGHKIFVLPSVLKNSPKNGENFHLWTHLRVKEDALDLYGFAQYPELQFFETLIQISGIGPKSAMGILSIAPLDTLKKAIAAGEVSYLTKVSGVGRKTAEKVIIELRDKMGELDEAGKAMFKDDQSVLEALVSLGYSNTEAREALKQVPDGTTGVNARIKEALKILGK